MKINSAEFVISNTDTEKCPEPNLPEYAFIGRSNVGKSSLINALTNRKSLAKTSGTPGKTQLINHFMINDEWYLVDLPGYGYAKTSKKNSRVWNAFIQKYLVTRPNLITVFILLDSRHTPQKVDLEFMEWLATKKIPFVMAFTKIDKLSSSQLNKNLTTYKKEMLKKWDGLPPTFSTSSSTKIGTEKILQYIDAHNPIFYEAKKK
jgi:GTP-binding protein